MQFWKAFIFCFFTSSGLLAFNNTDSLIQILPQLKGIEKVDLLNRLSWTLKFSKNETARQFAEDGFQLARALEYTKGEGLATYHLSVIYSIKGDYEVSNQYADDCVKIHQKLDNAKYISKGWNVKGINMMNQAQYEEALNYLNKAIEIARILADTGSMLIIEGNIGSIYFLQGDYEKALIFYDKLIEYGEENKDTIIWANNLKNAGSINSLTGDHPKALEQFFLALDLYQATNSQALIANILSEIGLVLKRVGMYEEAKEVILDAIRLNEQEGNVKTLGILSNNLGIVHFRLEEYDEAVENYEKALDYYQQAKVKSIGNILSNIADVHEKRGDFETAEKMLFRALENDSLLNKPPGIAHRYMHLGENYLKQNELEKAEKYLLKAYALWTEIGQVKDLSSTAGHLANLYEAKGDLEKALVYLTEYKETQDSVYGLDRHKEVTRILLQRQEKLLKNTAQEELEVEDTAKDGLGIIIILLLGGILSFFLYKRWQLQKQKSQLQLEFEVQNKHLKNLQSSLEQKNIEVAFLSLTTIQKDEFIHQFSQKLNEFVQKHPQNREAQKLLNTLHFQDVNAKDWDYFKQSFEQISPGFFDKLFELYPKLSNKELRHCALIRLNISPKDAAQILGISMSGVHKARYRLRKQFGLDRRESLENYLNAI